MLSEAIIDWKIDSFFIKANFFTDIILLCLSKYISTQAVLFSSFSPKICIMLALKHFYWLVVFDIDSRNWQLTNIRTLNLQETISFAKKWEIDSVVLANEPFIFTP